MLISFVLMMLIISTLNRTRPIFDTVNPTWDEEWHLGNVHLGLHLVIELWDYDQSNKGISSPFSPSLYAQLNTCSDDYLGVCMYQFDGKVF
jgi:hypothetical protein